MKKLLSICLLLIPLAASAGWVIQGIPAIDDSSAGGAGLMHTSDYDAEGDLIVDQAFQLVNSIDGENTAELYHTTNGDWFVRDRAGFITALNEDNELLDFVKTDTIRGAIGSHTNCEESYIQTTAPSGNNSGGGFDLSGGNYVSPLGDTIVGPRIFSAGSSGGAINDLYFYTTYNDNTAERGQFRFYGDHIFIPAGNLIVSGSANQNPLITSDTNVLMNVDVYAKNYFDLEGNPIGSGDELSLSRAIITNDDGDACNLSLRGVDAYGPQLVLTGASWIVRSTDGDEVRMGKMEIGYGFRADTYFFPGLDAFPFIGRRSVFGGYADDIHGPHIYMCGPGGLTLFGTDDAPNGSRLVISNNFVRVLNASLIVPTGSVSATTFQMASSTNTLVWAIDGSAPIFIVNGITNDISLTPR